MQNNVRSAPFYQFVRTSQPTAGAMDMAFESEMLAWRPLIGPGIGQRQQFATVFATPQNYQATAMLWFQGMTGIVQGQVALQPLSNPYQ